MTTHFLDIKVLPDPETNAARLIGALHDRIHLMLVQTRANTIGVSFPEYSLSPRSIGTILRLHGREHALKNLAVGDWLKGVVDHVQMSSVKAVPAQVMFRTVTRKQFKTNVDRLRRRHMKRKNVSYEAASAAIPDDVERRPNLPFVNLRSRSTAQPYCLFVALGPLSDAPTDGEFNSHGLSTSATVPWF